MKDYLVQYVVKQYHDQLGFYCSQSDILTLNYSAERIFSNFPPKRGKLKIFPNLYA